MTKKTMKTKCILMFLAVGVVLVSTAVGVNIDIPDGTFDEHDVGDGGWSYVSNIIGGDWFATGAAAGGSPWIGNNYGGGYPTLGHTGAQWVDLNADYIYQALPGETFEKDVIYELSAWATTTSGGQGLYFYFLDGDTLDLDAPLFDSGLIEVAVENNLSTWSPYGARYIAAADAADKTIGIGIYGASITYIDTVSLVRVGVVEPVKPLLGAPSVGVDETLEWTSPTTFEALGYDVYFGTDPNKLHNPLVVDNEPTNTFDPFGAGDMAYDTTYHWWVDVYEPNDAPGGGSILREGEAWHFTTEPESPVILADPENVLVGAGGTAVFSIEQKNGATYKWYKVGTGEVASGTVEGSTVTLSISNVDAGDEGEYYCEVFGVGSAQSAGAQLTIAKLISHWRFEENLNDSVNGNHGYSAGPGGEVTYAAGKIDNFAISLNGADPNEVVLVDHDEKLNSEAFTVALWVKAAGGSGTWRSPLTSRSETEDLSTQFGYNLYASTSDTWQFWTGANGWHSIGSTVVAEDEWVFLVATYDGRTLEKRLYVNGENVAQAVLGAPINLNPAPNLLKIGGGGGGEADLNYIFNGLIDDVKIWNYPLNPFAVARLYTDVEGGTICAAPELLLYDFDNSCAIDIGDIAEFALKWLACNFAPDCLDEHVFKLD